MKKRWREGRWDLEIKFSLMEREGEGECLVPRLGLRLMEWRLGGRAERRRGGKVSSL